MNQTPAGTTRNLGLTPMESIIFAVVVIFLGLGVLLFVAGELSGVIFNQDRPAASAANIPSIAAGVVSNLGDPAQAWPEESRDAVPGPIPYYFTLLFIIVGLVIGAKYAHGFWTGTFGNKDLNNAQWAKARDLKPLIVQQAGIRGRLVLGRSSGKLIATEPRMSVIVLGPTQTGKTTGFAVPAILEWDGPVIAASVKNDLVKDTFKWRKTQGDVWLFDPTRSTGFDYEEVRAGWSPLSQAIEWGGARKVASWLCKANKAAGNNLSDGDFWFSAAEKLMSPYLFAAAVGGKDMSTILRWIDTQEEREVLSILQRAGVGEAMTAFEANMKRDERTKSSIFTTAETIIDAYNDPLVCESAANPTIFSSELLNGGKNTLYICAPSHEQERLQSIFTAIVSQMKSAAYELAGKQNRPIDPPLLICIDEAANIAPLSDLDAIASTAAGIGIQLVTIFQDMAQIESRYKDRARTVVNNHRAKVVLSGISDSGTLEYVSKICGEEEVEQTSTNISAQGERSTTESKQQRTLASGSYLRRMKFGEGIVVYGQLAPAKLVLRPWYKDRVLKHMVEHGSKPGVMGGSSGANTFAGADKIVKDPKSQEVLSSVPRDSTQFSNQSANEMSPTGSPYASKQLGSVATDPSFAQQSSPQADGQLSAFDKALAELRARDTTTPPQPEQPSGDISSQPPQFPATAPTPSPSFGDMPQTGVAPAPSSFSATPTSEPKYTPGVPLISEEPQVSSASPSKWKPTSGGVPEEPSVPSGFAAVAKPVTPSPTPAVETPLAPTIPTDTTSATSASSATSSKWSKGSHPKFKSSDTTAPQVPTPPQAAPPQSSPTQATPPTAPVPPTTPAPSVQTPPVDVSDLFAQYSSTGVVPSANEDEEEDKPTNESVLSQPESQPPAPKSKWK